MAIRNQNRGRGARTVALLVGTFAGLGWVASTASAADATATTQLDSVSVVSGVLQPPVLIEPAPTSLARYPLVAMSNRVEGTTTVRALVGADGRVSQVSIKQTSGYVSLDSAALAHLRARAFVPAQRAGQAVAAWVAIPVTYELPDPAPRTALPVNRLAAR